MNNKEPTRKVIWSKCREAIASAVRDVKCLCRILKHPETPWRARIILFLPIAYICSPIQLLPNFIPVIGQLDDLFMIWVANRIVQRLVSEKIRRECREEVERNESRDVPSAEPQWKNDNAHAIPVK